MAEIDDLLAEADLEIERQWPRLEGWLRSRFGRDAGLESILFLIGIQSRGSGYTPQLEKEEKQNLIMEGSYHALSRLGFYDHSMAPGSEDMWARRVDLPPISVDQQESLLKLGVLRYFEQFMDQDP